jgi:hypothetical protein
VEATVYEISKKSLEHNIIHLKNNGDFLSAGAHQFKSLWTRDFCFSVKGLLSIGREDVVKNQLEYLITHQREDHLIPLYVDSLSPILRVAASVFFRALHIKKEISITDKISPYYMVNGQHEVIDSNLVFLYAAKEYINATHDFDWEEQHKEDFKNIFNFYLNKIDDLLIVQTKHADWQDSAKRSGKAFFTNLLYYQVASEFGFLTNEGLENLKNKIISIFYDKGTGLFKTLEGKENISLDGNLWAIDNELLVDPNSLYQSFKKHPLFLQYDIPGFATFPSYPSSELYKQVKIVGLREYHGNLFWSWLMAYSAKVAFKQKDFSTFNLIYRKIDEILKRDQVVYEIYNNDNDHDKFQNKMYKSESPFSWGAAFVLDLENFVKLNSN